MKEPNEVLPGKKAVGLVQELLTLIQASLPLNREDHP